MTIKQQGGVFGRNPTFNDVTIEGQLTFDGDIDINSDLKVSGDIETTGNVIIGTSGKGIDFSATAALPGSTSELFNDYEEGLYDITATDNGGGATIVLKSYTNELRYTKIGSLVHVHGRVQVDSVTGTWSGALSINLPFVSANLPDTAESTGSVMTQYADYASGSPVCIVSEGSSALVFYASNPSAGVSLVQVPANQYVAFSIQYVAA